MTGVNDPSNLNATMTIPSQSKDPFERYDVVETSLHFNIKRLDLHIIADSEALSKCPAARALFLDLPSFSRISESTLRLTSKIVVVRLMCAAPTTVQSSFLFLKDHLFRSSIGRKWGTAAHIGKSIGRSLPVSRIR